MFEKHAFYKFIGSVRTYQGSYECLIKKIPQTFELFDIHWTGSRPAISFLPEKQNTTQTHQNLSKFLKKRLLIEAGGLEKWEANDS